MESLISGLKSLTGRVLFLGMGNPLKGDDAAGLVLLERLKDSPLAKGRDMHFWDCATSPENYAEKISRGNFDVIVVLDAVHMEKEAGALAFIDPQKITSFSVSTHSLSPRMFIEYLALSTKATIKFLGIQPKATMLGEGLSPEISAAVDSFVKLL